MRLELPSSKSTSRLWEPKIWFAWDLQMPHFDGSVAVATSHSTEQLEPGRAIHTGRSSVGMPLDRFITYTEGTAAFLEDYSSEAWDVGLPRPGTKVLTGNGEVNIEDVRGGTRTITRAPNSVKGYKNVQIKKLYSEDTKCLTVHGVHLHKGLQSYHTDSFLTFSNYQKVALEVSMARSSSELQPLLDRCGAGTISDLLSREIRSHNNSNGPDRYHGPPVTKSVNFDKAKIPVIHLPLTRRTYQDVGTYSLLCDIATWEDHWQESKDYQPFLEMTTCIDDHTLQFTGRFPLLDAIRDAACAKLRKSGPLPLESQM
ncbi:hypothetical protein S40288_11262 [Stachybotrys chartarum IBT 40288]|nr:hypothetical protein S40288_11262 [Stachybotrys chartarum IBT 40288]